ncbi:MAG: hypothetical protein FMNOHCHN_00815 [Ignavibacteriaceae bacterium]|nr:hypothetical protein [Ignavibacteriaceae bacterium]
MGLDFNTLHGQTPLDEDEKEGLLIPAISTRGELDEFEHRNIMQAMIWSVHRSFRPEKVFSEAFIRELHKRMYGEVWNWAGSFRKTDKNIGVDKWQIATEMRKLLDDVKFWYEHNTFTPDETAVRFKHRLVSIHCFPNGNGRHSRLMADIIINKIYDEPVFSWGAKDLIAKGTARTVYLDALRSADRGDITPLIKFARS